MESLLNPETIHNKQILTCQSPRENVILFESEGREELSVFLVGFEGFRREEGRTRRLGDETIEKNLYRHPSRQGTTPESDFIMQHDIYNLGVCLLEIGLWESFLDYYSVVNPTLSHMFEIRRPTSKEDMMQFLLQDSKDYFLYLAQVKLRECMGTKYSKIVETCLTCLDPGNSDFGDPKEFEDEDGIRVGVRYIEKVSFLYNERQRDYRLLSTDTFTSQLSFCVIGGSCLDLA